MILRFDNKGPLEDNGMRGAWFDAETNILERLFGFDSDGRKFIPENKLEELTAPIPGSDGLLNRQILEYGRALRVLNSTKMQPA